MGRLRLFAAIVIILITPFSALAKPNCESNFVAAPNRFERVHSPTIVELPAIKKLLSCWYAGSREMGPDVQIYCSHADAIGRTWSEPWVAVAAQEKHTGDFLKSKSIGNPVLFHDSINNVTYLFFGTVTIGGWRGVRSFYRISKDFGKTWSESIPIEGAFPDGSDTLGRIGKFVRIKPLQVSTNEFLLPMYTEWDDKRSFTCSFTRRQNGLFQESNCSLMPGKESLQPSLVYFAGKVHAYTRSRNGFVQHSTYDLTTKQWASLETLAIPNPNSSVDTALDKSGAILLVGNANSSDRNSLDLLISQDGRSFEKIFSFANSSQSNDEFSYPALIKTEDGMFHLVFTHLRTGIMHIRFSND